MAAVAQGLLEDYFTLDAAEKKPAATFDLKSDVTVGPDVIAVSVDICIFEAAGYGARLVLWDTRGCTREQARVMLAPCVVAIEQEFGSGAAESAAVWHMRSLSQFAFTAQAARTALGTAAAILRHAQE